MIKDWCEIWSFRVHQDDNDIHDARINKSGERLRRGKCSKMAHINIKIIDFVGIGMNSDTFNDG